MLTYGVVFGTAQTYLNALILVAFCEWMTPELERKRVSSETGGRGSVVEWVIQ